MRIRFLYFLLFCSITLLNCVQSHHLAYEATPRTPKPSDHPVEIIDVRDVEFEYKVIGEISIFSNILSSSEKMRKELFSRTRKMGGDAIIDFESTPVLHNQYSQQGDNGSNGDVIWKGKVIVYSRD